MKWLCRACAFHYDETERTILADTICDSCQTLQPCRATEEQKQAAERARVAAMNKLRPLRRVA